MKNVLMVINNYLYKSEFVIFNLNRLENDLFAI